MVTESGQDDTELNPKIKSPDEILSQDTQEEQSFVGRVVERAAAVLVGHVAGGPCGDGEPNDRAPLPYLNE